MNVPSARRGRPVSSSARVAVLTAAGQLLDERGWPGFSIDEVARRSRVSKATIYKHWSGGFAIAIEAYGALVDDEVPTMSTGDASKDLRDQVVQLARFYRSWRGRVAAQLLGAGIGAADGASLVRDRFFQMRRRSTEELISEAVRAGQLRSDLAPALMVDLLFGPIMFRLMNGLAPLSEEEAGKLADLTISALVGPHFLDD